MAEFHENFGFRPTGSDRNVAFEFKPSEDYAASDGQIVSWQDHDGNELAALLADGSWVARGSTTDTRSFKSSGDETTRAGRASIVQAAITHAAAQGHPYVFVADEHLNYDASAVTFDGSVRMIREGGDPGVFDVQAYGAAGDGSADDTSAAQAALDAVTSGGVVFLPEGTYRITSNLTISNDDTVIEGQGWSSIISADSGETIPRPILIDGADNCIVRNLQVDGQDATVVGRQGIAIRNGANYATVERCYVRRCGQYGIVVSDAGTNGGAAGHVIRHNRVDMTGVSGASTQGIEIFPKGGAGFLADPGVVLLGNTVIADTAESGIKVNAQRGVRIEGNYVTGATDGSSTGAINLTASEDAAIIGNTIRDTRIAINCGGPAGSDNGLRCSDVVVQGNVISKVSNSAFFSSDGVDGLTITGNDARVDGGAASFLVDLQPADSGAEFLGLAITGNLLIGAGIRLLDDDSTGNLGFPRALITDNRILQATNQGCDIDDADDLVLQGNLFFECDRAGVLINDSARPQFIGNTFVDCNVDDTAGQDGITAISCANSSTRGNSFVNATANGNLKYGVEVNGSSGHEISDNRYIGMDTGEVNVAGGATLKLRNGLGEESANAETPTAANWSPGNIVDFTDTGDASGDGQYLLLRDGSSWAQLA